MDRGKGGGAQRARARLRAGIGLGESRRLTPAAGPAIEEVRADDRVLGQRRRPIGNDIIGVIMGRPADRRIDRAAERSLRRPSSRGASHRRRAGD